MKLLWTDESGATLEIEFDASVSEEHKAAAEITKHPLESGASVTDHVVAGPETLSVEARVSNTPVRAPRTQMRGVSGAVSALALGSFPVRRLDKGAIGSGPQAAAYAEATAQATAQVLQFSGPFDRVGDIHRLLLELRKGGQVTTVVTSLRQYESMVLTEVSAPRSAEDSNAVTFSLSFEQVSFADSRTVDVPEPSEPRGRGAGNAGHQPGTEASAEAAAGSRSILAQARDAISNAFR